MKIDIKSGWLSLCSCDLIGSSKEGRFTSLQVATCTQLAINASNLYEIVARDVMRTSPSFS